MSALLESWNMELVDDFLNGLSPNAILALPYLFEHWAHADHQLPPEGDWTTWVVLGGRGAGKTRAGSEWVRSVVEGATPLAPGACRHVALVADTYDQGREVMVLGESGLIACSPPDRRPEWIATRRRLVWPNGADAQVFSAADPEALRGPQFDAAWSDELAKWRDGSATWDNLQLALRLGARPRQVVTTTPRKSALLRRILAEPGTVQTRAPTSANRLHLADGFLEKIAARYQGTRFERQEILGEFADDLEGALWTRAMLEGLRRGEAPALDRIVVAVDPPVSTGEAADTCGIVVAGLKRTGGLTGWEGYVLEDASVAGASPGEWAAAAVQAFHRHSADRLVAEINQGGDLVEAVVRQVDDRVPYRPVRATRGKIARCEPVAALYEQGRVFHVGDLAPLEEQMCEMTATGFQGAGSPDRVDALVWALTDLIIAPTGGAGDPQVRPL